MKIALLGYGKMGHAIEESALQRGHSIVLTVSIENLEDNTIENISKADVAIEFTGPESAYDNIKKCIDAGVPVVCGSTGWLEMYEDIKGYCLRRNGSFLYSSNFSVGVNIFFSLNSRLAELMNSQPDYNVSIKEIHHTQKKDAPSGTAITLAEQIFQKLDRKKKWVNNPTSDENELEIVSERKDMIPGTHIVTYHSAIDDIEIIHTAHNRKGFALGAVLAAEFLRDKKGVHSMSEVLGI